MILSGGQRIDFFEENGQQVTRESEAEIEAAGTQVSMAFDWPAETGEHFDTYFARLLVPTNVRLVLNGRQLSEKPVAHTQSTSSLRPRSSTPENHSWSKPEYNTRIELIATGDR